MPSTVGLAAAVPPTVVGNSPESNLNFVSPAAQSSAPVAKEPTLLAL